MGATESINDQIVRRDRADLSTAAPAAISHMAQAGDAVGKSCSCRQRERNAVRLARHAHRFTIRLPVA